MAFTVSTAGAAFEFETTLANYFSKPIAIDTNHFFATYGGSGSDGFASVFEVNTSTWAVTEAGTIEHDTQNSTFNSAVKIDTNHFANFHLGGATTTDGFVQVFTVNTTTWAITTSSSSFLFDTDVGSHNSAVMIDANHIINFWCGAAADGFVQVFTVNTTTWAVTTAAAQLEFDTVIALENSALAIDDNHFINFWAGELSDGYVQVFTVNTTTWAVTTAAARLEFDTQNAFSNSTYKIDTNHFINFWQDIDVDGKVQVFTVNTTTWAVTTANATLEFDTQNNAGVKASVDQVDANHFIQVWCGLDSDGYAQIFEVNTTTWAVTTASATLEFDTTLGQYAVISAEIAGAGKKYLALWSGSGSDGYAQVLNVQAPPDQVTLNSPADASSDTDTTPTLDFTGTDLNSDSLRYNVQIDTVNTFDSQGVTPVVCDSYSESNSNADAFISSGYATLLSQSFTGVAGLLESCKFYLAKTGSPTGNVTAYLYAMTGVYGSTGHPTGSALATSDTLDISTLTTSPALKTFTFDGTYRLVEGTKYCIVVEYAGGSAFDYLEVWKDTTSPSHSGSEAVYDGAWTDEAHDACFYVYIYPETPLHNKISGTDSGFANPDNGGDTDPFNAGENIQFTVQGGDALAVDTYYWRVKAIDPSGSNTYGAWSSTRSFNVTAAAGGATVVNFKALLGVGN